MEYLHSLFPVVFPRQDGSFSVTYRLQCQQESIPVGCVPSASVAISPAMHAPRHARPPPHMLPTTHPPAMHVPQPCMTPPTMHASLSCMPTLPLVYRILDIHFWKHYLSATSFADGNKGKEVPLCTLEYEQLTFVFNGWVINQVTVF